MKIGLFIPYGKQNNERNLISVLGLYLNSFGHELSIIGCDGQVSCCERDQSNNWKKTLKSCTNCIFESKSLSTFANFPRVSLADSIDSVDERQIREIVLDLKSKFGTNLSLGKINLDVIMLSTLLSKFGTTEINLKDQSQSEFYTNLLTNTLRILFASAKMNQNERYDLVFLAGGKDYISASMRQSLLETKTKVVIFRYDDAVKATHIIHQSKSQLITSNVFINSVREYLNPINLWNKNIINEVNSILNFLEIDYNQMSLPLVAKK